MERKRSRYKVFSLIVICIILGTLLLIPKTTKIHETFTVYPLETSGDPKTFEIDIAITGSRLPFFHQKHDVNLTIDGRSYKYVHANFPDRTETYIPLSIGVFKFGVLLPDNDFGEFIILFDEAHHFGENQTSYYTAYPQRNAEDTKLLLNKLIEQNRFDIENKTIK